MGAVYFTVYGIPSRETHHFRMLVKNNSFVVRSIDSFWSSTASNITFHRHVVFQETTHHTFCFYETNKFLLLPFLCPGNSCPLAANVKKKLDVK